MLYRTFLLFFTVFSFVLNCVPLSAQTDSLIFAGIDHSIRQNYRAAEEIFQKIVDQNPDHPQGYFFLAATLQSKMMDFETDIWADEFLSLIDKCEDLSNKLIKENEHDAWAHFYLGSAKSYRAFYYGKKKKYVSAIRNALSGMSTLHKVVQLDSTIYDAHFGIGSYKYWRSRLTKLFNWLPLISDERQKGIDMVKLSAEKGKYTQYAAINEMTWILIDYGKTTEALSWAKQGLQKYPDSRFFLWGTAKSYFSLQQYEKALEVYKSLLDTILREKMNNHYNETICYYKIAECYYGLDQMDLAIDYCGRIDSLKTTPFIQQRLNDIYTKSKELKMRITEKQKVNLYE